MDDLISRQAAIDAMQKAVKNIDSMNKADIVAVIEDLPSAQPKPLIINIDNELTEEEYKKLKQEIADSPVVLLPSAQPEIIRCKDCRHNQDCDIQYDAQAGEKFYCGAAERRLDA